MDLQHNLEARDLDIRGYIPSATSDSRGRLTQEIKHIHPKIFNTEWGYNSADLLAWMKCPSNNLGDVGEQLNYTYHRQMALDSIVNTAPFTYVASTSYRPEGCVNVRVFGEDLLQTDYDYYAWTGQGGY